MTAKAGIWCLRGIVLSAEIPAFAGMTS